jgi:23S rRNA (cytidine1920-2'-O)/16S rRNA (cytidine1409-2'-O)-methyltransferase
VSRRVRLDTELVRRGLARSREQAAELVEAGRVQVSGKAAVKAATQVLAVDPIVVRPSESGPDYVSRGAHKLLGALAAFQPLGLVVDGRRCLDAGASTGGFTDVLLRCGAAHVHCVDVGYGQLAWSLRTDDRVTVLDRTNVRTLEPAAVQPPADLVVTDLSFISVRLVLGALVRCATGAADFLPMVKPQFEVGRDLLGPGGVVRDPEQRAGAVREVARAAYDEHGLGVRGVVASPLPGPAGNVEYFLWLRRDAPELDPADLAAAIAAGPQ